MVNLSAPAAEAAAPDLLTLENDHLLVAINRQTGCVDKLESRDQSWKLRAGGLRLHVPAPDHRFHYLTEHHGGKPRIESGSNHATIAWNGFESDRMGRLDIDLTESIRLEGAAVHFSYEIRNGSPAVIESYTYPRLRGLKPPGADTSLRQVAWGYSGMGSTSLWPSFGNEVGYYGYDTPAQLRNLGADTQFLLVLGDAHGLYMGYHDQGQKQVVQICFSLQPAYVDSFNSSAVAASAHPVDAAVGIDPIRADHSDAERR